MCGPHMASNSGFQSIPDSCPGQVVPVWPSVSLEGGAQPPGTPQPQSAPSLQGPHLSPPSVGTLKGGMGGGSTGSTRGSCWPYQAWRHKKPFLCPQQPHPTLLTGPTPGLPSPWPGSPSCLQAGHLPDKAGFRPHGAGGRQERILPWRRTLTHRVVRLLPPIYSFRPTCFRVNITPLFNPAPPSHIPGPDLQPLLMATLHPSSLEAQGSSPTPNPPSGHPHPRNRTRPGHTQVPAHAHRCTLARAMEPPLLPYLSSKMAAAPPRAPRKH